VIARRVALLSLLATAGASGWYFGLYLTRWEWNRAFVAALIFVAAEVAFFGALAVERLGRIHRDLRRRLPAPDDDHVLGRIREHAPPPRDPFAWLDPTEGRAPVFVPVLLGAGVVVSALAWVVERIARVTAAPPMEAALARRLGRLSPPHEPLVDPDDDGVFAPSAAARS
jgi:hypothetical protein